MAQEFEAIETELSQLGEPVEMLELQASLNEAKGELSSAEKALAEAQKDLQLAITAEAVAGRSYRDQIADVPEQLRDPEELRVCLDEVTRLVATRQQELAAAEEDARVAREQVATANANLTNAQKATADANDACERARLQFGKRLAELGLSADRYTEFVADVPEIEDLAAAVEAFDSSLREAKGAARQAAEAIKDVDRPNLSEFLELRVAARMAATEALDFAASSRARLDALENLKAELATELGRLRQLEEETGPLRTLAEAFSGQNEMNTTLESFAIGAMFDQVLEAANLRLEPMTSGRYRLERDTESSGGRSKRGLDIRIHDIETGRPRDLTTLSGGETFIAALSLALGLSDIVEASHGAIRLDTIFIDEGFGSLDTENDSGTL